MKLILHCEGIVTDIDQFEGLLKIWVQHNPEAARSWKVKPGEKICEKILGLSQSSQLENILLRSDTHMARAKEQGVYTHRDYILEYHISGQTFLYYDGKDIPEENIHPVRMQAEGTGYVRSFKDIHPTVVTRYMECLKEEGSYLTDVSAGRDLSFLDGSYLSPLLGDTQEIILKNLRLLWVLAVPPFAEMMRFFGIEKAKLTGELGIPASTVNDWYTESRKAKLYMRLMIAEHFGAVQVKKTGQQDETKKDCYLIYAMTDSDGKIYGLLPQVAYDIDIKKDLYWSLVCIIPGRTAAIIEQGRRLIAPTTQEIQGCLEITKKALQELTL